MLWGSTADAAADAGEAASADDVGPAATGAQAHADEGWRAAAARAAARFAARPERSPGRRGSRERSPRRPTPSSAASRPLVRPRRVGIGAPAWVLPAQGHAEPARGAPQRLVSALGSRPDAVVLRAVAQRTDRRPCALRVRVLTGPVSIGEPVHALPHVSTGSGRAASGGFVFVVPWTHSLTWTLRVDVVLEVVPLTEPRTTGAQAQAALPDQSEPAAPTGGVDVDHAAAVQRVINQAASVLEDSLSSSTRGSQT